jgi:hypothetical protein
VLQFELSHKNLFGQRIEARPNIFSQPEAVGLNIAEFMLLKRQALVRQRSCQLCISWFNPASKAKQSKCD